MDKSLLVTAKLSEMYKLKALPRTGWLRKDVKTPESVAAHSWGLTLLAALLTPPGLDRLQVLEIASLHDLAEAEVGDLTPQDGISAGEKHSLETLALDKLSSGLGETGGFLKERFEKYQRSLTPEARFVHALDKLDMALQALSYQREYPQADFGEFIATSLNYYAEQSLDKSFPELYALLREIALEAASLRS